MNFSYIPQNVVLLNQSIAENIALGVDSDKIDKAKIIDSLSKAEMLNYVKGLKDRYNTVVGENGVFLSGGQTSKISLSPCVVSRKKILVLDEGTSALDPVTERRVLNTIRNLEGVTIIIISHSPNVLNYCNTSYIVNNKKLEVASVSTINQEFHKSEETSNLDEATIR